MPIFVKINDRQQESGLRSIPASVPYSQPWWQGLGNNDMPSAGQLQYGSIASPTLQPHGTGEGVTKDTETGVALPSGLNNSNNGKEQQHLDPNSQMELVGHSIMLTSYPYADPQYGAMLTYGAPVHPHLLGYHPARMPLPLEMEEEPVYVNAKQYHGILRRRQIRARAELEKKLVKNKKPYLHESRHRHAMRRQRGSGGRFLNTKKLDDNVKNSGSGDSKSGENTTRQSNGNSLSNQQGNGTYTAQEIHKEQILSNGFSNRHNWESYYTQSAGKDLRNGNSGEDNWNSLVNRVPQGP